MSGQPRTFQHRDYERLEDGVYTTVLLGVKVRVVRGVVGDHPHYHTFSRQPMWNVKVADVEGAEKLGLPVHHILSEGHTSRNGAVTSAEDMIERRLKGT